MDQAQLETVLPAEGGTVVVVRGPHKGSCAQMLAIDVDKFSAQVQFLTGGSKREKAWFEYEDICKVFSSSS